MVIIKIDELKLLLSEESDIMVNNISQGVVYLEYPPLDIDSDNIFIHDEKYMIELDTLLSYVSDEIFLSPVEALYNENDELEYFVVQE